MALNDGRTEAFRGGESRSARLYERAKKVLPGGNTRTTLYEAPYPSYAASGRGAVITDVEGEERLDFINNYTSLIHGHADPDINAAVIAQLPRGVAFAMPTESEIALAELLVDRIPALEQVRFTNSGTEGVMMALKAARAFTGRPKIARFEGSYHGSYDFAEVGYVSPPEQWTDGDPASFPTTAGTPQGVLDNVVVLPYNDIDAVERIIERERQNLAAVLIDLMPSRFGLVQAQVPFLQRLREITRAYGIVLIFDEVISLRVGYHGMQGMLGVTPDLISMGKIIGGGFPVGALGGAAEIMAVFDPSQGSVRAPHGGTFNANPITMVAGRVAMEKLTRDEFARLDRLGDTLRESLAEVMDGERVPGQITGAGSLFNIHLHDRPLRDYRSAVETPAERARRGALHRALVSNGVVISLTLFGCLSTPMGEGEVNTFVDAFGRALRESAG
jgi:glutamate-1-semialdehyde 2,1-aminomutase